jgi:hypothetical protein
VRQEIEQVKQDIKKLNRSRESEEENERAKKKAKKSFIQLERQKYLSSGKAVTGKRKRGSEADVSSIFIKICYYSVSFNNI